MNAFSRSPSPEPITTASCSSPPRCPTPIYIEIEPDPVSIYEERLYEEHLERRRKEEEERTLAMFANMSRAPTPELSPQLSPLTSDWTLYSFGSPGCSYTHTGYRTPISRSQSPCSRASSPSALFSVGTKSGSDTMAMENDHEAEPVFEMPDCDLHEMNEERDDGLMEAPKCLLNMQISEAAVRGKIRSLSPRVTRSMTKRRRRE
jgi:hypothetical protein